MKKRLAVLIGLIMVMSFSFAACGGGGSSDQDLSDSKYVGTWKASTLSLGEASEDVDDGGEWVMTLNGDGTGQVISRENGGEEETADITWALTDDGFKTMGDQKLKFKDNGDDTLTTKLLGAEITFVREGAEGPDDGAPDIGTQYGYMGQDPVECAVWKYLCEDIAVMYDKDPDAITVPVVQIVKTEEGEDGDTEVYGDFWVFNYVPEGDTLKFVSGGAHPGRMHVVKDGDEYKVASMDVVEDGGSFEPSAKEIFGDDYDKFMQISSDSDAREALRLKGLADYVKTNGIAVSKVQDYDAEPVDLDL